MSGKILLREGVKMDLTARFFCLFLAVLALIVGIYSSYAALNLPLNRVGEFQLDALLTTIALILFAYLGFCALVGAHPLKVIGEIRNRLGGGCI